MPSLRPPPAPAGDLALGAALGEVLEQEPHNGAHLARAISPSVSGSGTHSIVSSTIDEFKQEPNFKTVLKIYSSEGLAKAIIRVHVYTSIQELGS